MLTVSVIFESGESTKCCISLVDVPAHARNRYLFTFRESTSKATFGRPDFCGADMTDMLRDTRNV